MHGNKTLVAVMFSASLGCAGSATGAGAGASANAGEGAAPDAVFIEEGGALETCPSEDLVACTYACSDASCIDWCAGIGCRATLAEVSSCINDADDRYSAQSPRPELVFVGPEGEEEPTEASLEREYAWDEAHREMLETQWEQACGPRCDELVAAGPEGEREFCTSWESNYFEWESLVTPLPEAQAGMLGVLGAGGDMGVLGGLFASALGSSLELVDNEALEAHPQASALRRLVMSEGWEIGAAEDCVPGIGEDSASFEFRIELDAAGRASGSTLVTGEGTSGECVGGLITAHFNLPPRVAQELGGVELRAIVQAMPDYGFGEMGGVGGLMGSGDDDYDYGYGGMGLSGTGRGGGGTGEGTIGGLGTGGLGTKGTGGGGGVGGGSVGAGTGSTGDDVDAD